MQEGWLDEKYISLFSQEESIAATLEYQLHEHIPGFKALGLLSWDDFLVMDSNGVMYTIPTVPLDPSYLSPYSLDLGSPLLADKRLEGKIKWYLKPLIFGGSATEEGNLVWVSPKQHAELVVWWNRQYQAAKA